MPEESTVLFVQGTVRVDHSTGIVQLRLDHLLLATPADAA